MGWRLWWWNGTIRHAATRGRLVSVCDAGPVESVIPGEVGAASRATSLQAAPPCSSFERIGASGRLALVIPWVSCDTRAGLVCRLNICSAVVSPEATFRGSAHRLSVSREGTPDSHMVQGPASTRGQDTVKGGGASAARGGMLSPACVR